MNSSVFLEYIWLDHDGVPRSKVRRTNPGEIKLGHPPDYYLSQLPVWNFDASSTGQNIGRDTEAVLKPVRVYYSPLNDNFLLVLCQLDLEYDRPSDLLFEKKQSEDDPDLPRPVIGFNTRFWASQVAERYQHLKPWFGLEQEYTFLDPRTNLPYRWEEHGSRQGQGDYYCSVRYPYCQLDTLVREHLILCDRCGIMINGFNAEVLPSQWEFQIGPTDLLKVADDLIMARYLLFRLAAKYQVAVTFHPKPMKGDWNGSGCHINFSTNLMRGQSDQMDQLSGMPLQVDGLKHIYQAVENLKQDHPRILKYYGEHNDQRLTGQHETSSMQDFSYGVGTRNTSVRIPNQVAHQKQGYIEDRRPASNIDPYLALGKILEVTQN